MDILKARGGSGEGPTPVETFLAAAGLRYVIYCRRKAIRHSE